MNNLKKIMLLLLFVWFLSSCSLESDTPSYRLEVLKIESVIVPDTLILGQIHKIKVKYLRPSTCHTFSNFIYEKSLNTRFIAVQNFVTESSDCLPLNNELKEAEIDFFVTNNGTYIFKFWQGKDSNGQDVYLEIEVPVQD
jgi:hypothetical protein